METLAQLFSCEFWKIFKNTFYRASPVAASVRFVRFVILFANTNLLS